MSKGAKVRTGFEIVGAASKRPELQDTERTREPMRPIQPGQVRRNPSTDQKKVRRQQAKTAAGDAETGQYDSEMANSRERSPHKPDTYCGHCGAAFNYHAESSSGNCPSCQSADLHDIESSDYDHDDLVHDDEHDPYGKHEDAMWRLRNYSKETSMTTEADLLAKMAAATTLPEQRELAAQLERIRAAKTAEVTREAQLDLSTRAVEAVVPSGGYLTHSGQVTAASDWLGEITAETFDEREVENAARAEASLWYGQRDEGLKSYPEEIRAQAAGISARYASQFGMQAEFAAHAFNDQVEHLISRTGLGVQDPPYTSPSGSSLPNVKNEDTFDGAQNPLSAGPDQTTKPGMSPSLSEGTQPQGDAGQGDNTNPLPENNDASSGSGPTQDYLDGTPYPFPNGTLDQTFSSLVREASLFTTAEDQKSDDIDSVPNGGGLSEGTPPAGDSSSAPMPSGTNDAAAGDDSATDYLDGRSYDTSGRSTAPSVSLPAAPYTSALREVAASLPTMPEAAAPFVAALFNLDESGQFAGYTAEQIVAHLAHSAGPALTEAHKAALDVALGSRHPFAEVPASAREGVIAADDDTPQWRKDEIEWIKKTPSQDVLDHAHRIYDYMHEHGQPAESQVREELFLKASKELGVPYDTLYDAWLSKTPAAKPQWAGWTNRRASLTTTAGESVEVMALPNCDVCQHILGKVTQAEYDARLPGLGGQWGNVCQAHFDEFGPGQLGTGYGQKYIVKGATLTTEAANACDSCGKRKGDVGVAYGPESTSKERGRMMDLCNACLKKHDGWKRSRFGSHTGARIDTLRTIVRQHTDPTYSGEHVDNKMDGMYVDPTTANMLVTVHDSLKPENRAKFETLPLDRLVDIGWKAVSPKGAALQVEAVAWARRHYEDVASVISGSPDRAKLADHFANSFAGTNPNYRPEQFKSAAGSEGYQVRGGTGAASYSRGHYQHIADTIKSAPEGVDKADLAKRFSDHFAAGNPRFDSGRFLKASTGNKVLADIHRVLAADSLTPMVAGDNAQLRNPHDSGNKVSVPKGTVASPASKYQTMFGAHCDYKVQGQSGEWQLSGDWTPQGSATSSVAINPTFAARVQASLGVIAAEKNPDVMHHLNQWVDALNEAHNIHAQDRDKAARGEFHQGHTFEIDPRGQKYLRIVQHSTINGESGAHSGSVHAFVNVENGDVHKAEGWKKPAKGARYNLLDPNSRAALHAHSTAPHAWAGGYLYRR